jgi:dipeptidyl aminopeptidase/acylaminoacyl peptidase
LIVLDITHLLLQREDGLYWRIPMGERWRTIILKAADKLPLRGRLGVPSGKGPFPTILEIHEGPSVQPDWLSPIAQAWVDAGFAYLVISFPGIQQGQFGLTFQERIMGHPGRWEVEDLLTAQRWLLEQGIAHPQQIVLTGWSYNAFVALLAAGQQPDLWAGVIAGNILSDWILEYEVGPDQALERELFDGSADEKRDAYLMSSPVTYIESVTAPIYIIQGRDTLFYSAQQAELYLEKMLAAGKTIDIRWQDVPDSTHDVELMAAQQQVMLEVARSMIKPPNND